MGECARAKSFFNSQIKHLGLLPFGDAMERIAGADPVCMLHLIWKSGLPTRSAPVSQGPSGLDWLANALGFWSGRALGACYWHGVGGFVFNPSSAAHASQSASRKPFFVVVEKAPLKKNTQAHYASCIFYFPRHASAYGWEMGETAVGCGGWGAQESKRYSSVRFCCLVLAGALRAYCACAHASHSAGGVFAPVRVEPAPRMPLKPERAGHGSREVARQDRKLTRHAGAMR